jgi:hypothetical protein
VIFTYSFADSFDSTSYHALLSYCMRDISHDATLRNDRKAELGIACPEIDLGCAVTAHKSYVRAHRTRTYSNLVPHQSVGPLGNRGLGMGEKANHNPKLCGVLDLE